VKRARKVLRLGDGTGRQERQRRNALQTLSCCANFSTAVLSGICYIALTAKSLEIEADDASDAP
jgi:hypothetical protein